MNAKNQKLGELASVFPGAAKSALLAKESESCAKAKLLKGQNLGQKGDIQIDDAQEVFYDPTSRAAKYVLQVGDVVIMARGSAIRCGYVSSDDHNIMASSNFLIVRPNTILGGFVAATLNTKRGAAQLEQLTSGGVILNITASSLRDLEIAVPSAEIQTQIKEIFLASQDLYKVTASLAEQQWETASARIASLRDGVT